MATKTDLRQRLVLSLDGYAEGGSPTSETSALVDALAERRVARTSLRRWITDARARGGFPFSTDGMAINFGNGHGLVGVYLRAVFPGLYFDTSTAVGTVAVWVGYGRARRMVFLPRWFRGWLDDVRQQTQAEVQRGYLGQRTAHVVDTDAALELLARTPER